jgi:Ca-activated chloride channel homolog
VTARLARWLVIAAAATAVLVAAVGRDDPEPQAAEPELVLRYIYSTDATDLLVPLIDRYNDETHRRGGREIRIVGIDLTSGEAQAALAAGDERAELWTPASSLWGELLNHSVSAAWVPDEQPVSLVYSTQVIAMWKPLARALGWPKRPIRWRDILDLATGKRTWDDYGYDYGEFLLGHTNPGFSTSGLSAVASQYYAAAGTQRALSLADVQRPDVRAAVQRIESSIVHQGETAGNLIDKMLKYDVGYAHAVYVQKTTLLREPLATELAAIEPADGTFVTDYPLIVMAAPWVGADARAAAREFRNWLAPRITAENATTSGFQLRRPTGLTELPRPEPEVFAEIQRAWHEDRKPANIVLVVDTSKSMGEGGGLKAAKQALISFLGELSPRDRIALITSGRSITTNVGLGVLEQQGPAVSSAVRALVPNGELPVYPAVTRALESLRSLDDSDRINAVVVLSDGAGTTDDGRDELLRTIARNPVTEGTSVRIFTVAYGRPPDARALQQIASDSDGLFFRGGPKNINDVYRKILSYF